MKKILFGLVLALTLVGCEGFLDENPPSRLTMEEAYSNSALVYLNTVAQLYSSLGIYGGYDDDFRGNNGYVYAFPHLTSDMFICPGRQGDWVDNGYYQNLFVQNYDSTYKMDKAAWSKIFNFVAKCNTAIDDLSEMLENGGEDFLKDYIAEIRALRAFVYTYALDFWGRVPILTTAKLEMSEVKQSERSKVFEFVRDELLEVIPQLPDAHCQTLGQEYYARMTKYVGYAMLAKLAANAPIYIRDNWPFADSLTFRRPIKIEAEDQRLSGVTTNPRTINYFAGKRYNNLRVMEVSKTTAAWEADYTIEDNLRGKYMVKLVIFPNTVVAMPNLIHPVVSYTANVKNEILPNGEKYYKRGTRKFALNDTVGRDLTKIDTVVIGPVDFPTSNYNNKPGRVTVTLKSAITNANANQFSNKVWLDCIILEPVFER